MPEVALGIGERRIDRSVVEVQHLLPGIALVIFEHGVGDGERNRAAIALKDITSAVVERLLQSDQRFLRVDLVVVEDDRELLAVQPARGVDLVYLVGEVLLGVDSGAGGAPGKRINERELDLGGRRSGEDRCNEAGDRRPRGRLRRLAHISS